MIRTDWTVPACWKSSRRSSSVAWYDRFPTNSFADMAHLPSPTQDTQALRRADPLIEGSDRGDRRVLVDGPTLRGSGRQCQGGSEVGAPTGSAIDRQTGAGDEPGSLGGQEGHHVRHVLGASDPPKGLGALDFGPEGLHRAPLGTRLLNGQALPPLRGGGAGAHRVDEDAVGRAQVSQGP